MPARLIGKKSRRLFEAVLAYVPTGIIVASAPDLVIVAISETASRQFGRSREALEGKPISSLASPYRLFRGDGSRAGFDDLPITRACLSGETVRDEQWVVEDESGRRVTLLINAGPVKSKRGKVLGGVISWADVTALKSIEAELRAAIETERTLLSESNHRIKNHFEMVASLVRMEAVKYGPQAAELARTIEDKLSVLAAAHEGLYAPRDTKNLSGQHLLAGVARALYSDRHQIRTHAAADIELEDDQVTTVGLVINEGISNCLKHAFADGRSGTIDVTLQWNGPKTLELTIADNGIGLSEPLRQGTLGLKIIGILARQLRGRFSLANRPEGGCLLKLTFPLNPAASP